MYENQEVKSVYTHEYGHVLADRFFQQINHRQSTYKPEMLLKRQLVNKAFRKAQQTGDIYKISMYANKNPHDFFAEAFTMRELGVEKLPDYIEEMFNEVLK